MMRMFRAKWRADDREIERRPEVDPSSVLNYRSVADDRADRDETADMAHEIRTGCARELIGSTVVALAVVALFVLAWRLAQ